MNIPFEEIENQAQKGKCPYCETVFEKLTALGGHISKAHAGRSTQYRYKTERYRERTFDRSLLACAKKMFVKKFPGCCPKKNRTKIAFLKLKIKQLTSKGISLEHAGKIAIDNYKPSSSIYD